MPQKEGLPTAPVAALNQYRKAGLPRSRFADKVAVLTETPIDVSRSRPQMSDRGTYMNVDYYPAFVPTHLHLRTRLGREELIPVSRNGVQSAFFPSMPDGCHVLDAQVGPVILKSLLAEAAAQKAERRIDGKVEVGSAGGF